MMMTKELVDKKILRIREIAGKLDDFRLAIRLLATIACVTGEKRDITAAIEKARGHKIHQSYTAECLSIIIKTLSRARRFEEAKEILVGMEGMDPYWTAEASIAVARFSGAGQDIEVANKAVLRIRSNHMRNEARADLEHALKGPHLGKKGVYTPDIKELASVLNQLKEFEDSHSLAPQRNSAALRLTAQMIIDQIFAKMMTE